MHEDEIITDKEIKKGAKKLKEFISKPKELFRERVANSVEDNISDVIRDKLIALKNKLRKKNAPKHIIIRAEEA